MSKRKLDPDAPRVPVKVTADDKKWQKLAKKLGVAPHKGDDSRHKDGFESAPKLTQLLMKLLDH